MLLKFHQVSRVPRLNGHTFLRADWFTYGKKHKSLELNPSLINYSELKSGLGL